MKYVCIYTVREKGKREQVKGKANGKVGEPYCVWRGRKSIVL
jgi:hypothetical protein